MKETSMTFSAHDTTVSGHLMGMKVSHTDVNELSAVVCEYKKAHLEAYTKVKLIFS